MRELLQYGLRGTDLEALITIGQGEDGSRSVLTCGSIYPCDVIFKLYIAYDTISSYFDTERPKCFPLYIQDHVQIGLP